MNLRITKKGDRVTVAVKKRGEKELVVEFTTAEMQSFVKMLSLAIESDTFEFSRQEP